MGTSPTTEHTDEQGGAATEAAIEVRRHVHAMWAAVAGSWGEHAAFVDARHLAVTGRMLELTTPRPGERVLELACGPGGAGLAAAEQVSPGGEVVLSDVAVEMTRIAAARAAAIGLDNVSTRVLDLEQIDQPDRTYDIVLCRDGLQFVPDPTRAAREIERVLRAGGRVALAVWGPRERNPWLGLVLEALSDLFDRPMPPPGVPGPFSLGDRDQLHRTLTGAGLAAVSVEELSVPLRAPSFDQWWAMTTALAGPLAMILSTLDADVLSDLQARAREAVQPYQTPTGLELPGLALVAAGRAAA